MAGLPPRMFGESNRRVGAEGKEINRPTFRTPATFDRLRRLKPTAEAHLTLEELMKAIEESDPSDWNYIQRPVFAQDIQHVSGGGHPVPWVEIEEHSSLLVFRKDLRISIAMGLRHSTEFLEDWAQKFPDKHATSTWVDFRYNGVPVLRELTVHVDGARAALPPPRIGTMEISERQSNIWQLIDAQDGVVWYGIDPQKHCG